MYRVVTFCAGRSVDDVIDDRRLRDVPRVFGTAAAAVELQTRDRAIEEGFVRVILGCVGIGGIRQRIGRGRARWPDDIVKSGAVHDGSDRLTLLDGGMADL